MSIDGWKKEEHSVQYVCERGKSSIFSEQTVLSSAVDSTLDVVNVVEKCLVDHVVHHELSLVRLGVDWGAWQFIAAGAGLWVN